MRYWIYRFPGYFSVQWIVIFLTLLVLSLAFPDFFKNSVFNTAALLIGAGWHMIKVFPHTRYGIIHVDDALNDDLTFSLLIGNVYQPNRQFDKMNGLIESKDADLLVLLETDNAWGAAIEKSCKELYPYQHKHLREDTYGLVFYSKFPISDIVEMQLYNKTPTLKINVDLPDFGFTTFYILHPKPPSPTEAATSIPKDAEFNVIGEEIGEDYDDEPVIVAGDLNDVPWSRSTRDMLRKSNLLDVMRGRRLLVTFPTYLPILGFPLDQIFVSSHFRYKSIERQKHIGSDHFPVYAQLAYSKKEASN